jgi:hypothetical protein
MSNLNYLIIITHGLFLFFADLSEKQEKAIFFSAPLCLE